MVLRRGTEGQGVLSYSKMSKGSSVCGFGEKKSPLDSWFSSISSVEGAGASWGSWAEWVMVMGGMARVKRQGVVSSQVGGVGCSSSVSSVSSFG